MRNLILISFSFRSQFDNLIKMISFRRITLLDNDFYYIFSFEFFIFHNWHIHNIDLNYCFLYLFFIVKIYSRNDLVRHTFDKEQKLIFLFSRYLLSDHLTLMILYSDIYRTAF